MAFLMLSEGMLTAFAAAMAVRSRGLPSGSPPVRAAMVISLITRVNVFPRLASRAPFLCLMVAHLECPDIWRNLLGWFLTRRIALGRTTTAYQPNRAMLRICGEQADLLLGAPVGCLQVRRDLRRAARPSSKGPATPLRKVLDHLLVPLVVIKLIQPHGQASAALPRGVQRSLP